MSFAASPLGFARARSMVFSEVPASEPSKPAEANADSPPTVSSMLSPNWDATSPPCFSAMPRSSTPPIALPAPAARRSATRGISAPDNLNWIIAVEAISAAVATSIVPAAARSRAPARPPSRVSAADTPARVNSSTAFAASVAENAVSAPAAMAASRS